MVGGFTAVVIWWLLCGDSCKPAASRLMLMAICCKASGTWMSQRVLPGHHAQLPTTLVTTLPVRVLHVAVKKSTLLGVISTATEFGSSLGSGLLVPALCSVVLLRVGLGVGSAVLAVHASSCHASFWVFASHALSLQHCMFAAA